MGERIRKLGPGVWVASAFVVWLVAFGTIRANVSGGVQPTSIAENSAVAVNLTQAQVASGATYVGQDTCLGCHDTLAEKYTDTAHSREADPRSPAARQGCESCHGPGSLHVPIPSRSSRSTSRR